MYSDHEREDLLPEYKQVPTQIKVSGQEKPVKAYLELRESVGELLFKDGYLEVVAPLHPDFPLDSGTQLQIVDRRHRQAPQSETAEKHLGEVPLVSESVDPKAVLRVSALGILVEEELVDKTQNVWGNFNLHTRPPLTPYTPVDAQYNELVLDIHGRSMENIPNWARPPATHGGWGIEDPGFYIDEVERIRDDVDGQGEIIPATIEEIAAHKHDPLTAVHGASATDITEPGFYDHWRSHPSGMYDWDVGRRNYFYSEMMRLKRIFGSKRFAAQFERLKRSETFRDEPVVHNDFEQSALFEPNETDLVLWEAYSGEHAYQLVTQRVPLTDKEEGIHMVLKLRNLGEDKNREPHTPWEDPEQTLESMAIGTGVARLLKDTVTMGEIGDVYLDMNANWSMNKRLEEFKGMTEEEVKAAIQERTRAHLHVQLEKNGAYWEIPPAPATFNENQMQDEATIREIRQRLNDPETGLAVWLEKHCRGSVFEKAA